MGAGDVQGFVGFRIGVGGILAHRELEISKLKLWDSHIASLWCLGRDPGAPRVFECSGDSFSDSGLAHGCWPAVNRLGRDTGRWRTVSSDANPGIYCAGNVMCSIFRIRFAVYVG